MKNILFETMGESEPYYQKDLKASGYVAIYQRKISKDLLYDTGSSTRYFLITYGKKYEKNKYVHN